jgi:hypothetical protein
MTYIDARMFWGSGAQRAHLKRKGLPAPPAVLEALNAVPLDGIHLRAAADLMGRMDGSAIPAQLAALAELAETARLPAPRLAAPALHVRVTALIEWCRRHPLRRVPNSYALHEAAARAPLVDGPAATGFEPLSFGELVDFLADTPF